ncbi:conjugal transfer protein TraK [Klebsiella pneumoniae]|nr:conjugal transfer protein TraK [Klebsiella pneumoniae]
MPACDHQPGCPWRKITCRLVSGSCDKGNPAGPAGLSSVADSVWTGNHLKMVRFVVENKTLSALNIRESDFWQPGTRAVMFSQPASQLLAGARMDVYVIRDGEGN